MDPSLPALKVLGGSVIVGLLLALLFLKFSNSDGRKGDTKWPPGPRPWPIVGNLPHVGPLLHQSFKALSDSYGPIFRLCLGSVYTIVVSSPALAEEVLKTKDVTFASRPRTSYGRIMLYDHSSSGLSPYGPYWRRARRLYTMQLMTVKQIRQFEKERSAELVRAVDSVISECKDGKAVRIDHVLWTIISNNICRMAFGKTYYGNASKTASAGESRAFQQAISDMFRLVTAPVAGDFIPFLRNFDVGGYRKEMMGVRRQLDEILENIIEEHQRKMLNRPNADAKGDPEQDYIDVLLTTASLDNESPLTQEQIKALGVEILGAGTETQVTTLSWIFSELLKNPPILSRAQEELDSVVGNDRMVQEADLPNLPYIQAIVNETFRLHPAVPLLLPHESFEASSLGNGYYIPKNATVFVNIWAMGRDPSLWENPLEFNPERFLNADIDSSGQDFKFLPFGSGRRACPGKQLALIMVGYSLAVLLHACSWALPQGVSHEEVDMREAPGLSAPPMVPLEVRASPRLPLSVIFAAG